MRPMRVGRFSRSSNNELREKPFLIITTANQPGRTLESDYSPFSLTVGIRRKFHLDTGRGEVADSSIQEPAVLKLVSGAELNLGGSIVGFQ